MMIQDKEGYIKFNSEWICKPIDIPDTVLFELNGVRESLLNMGYIGVLSDGVGFGNISIRFGDSSRFLITGSATGGLKKLEPMHLALVEEVEVERNMLKCYGLTNASSESMSHAVVYQHLPEVNAVIHIHSRKLWDRHFGMLPTTIVDAEYGTPAIAHSIVAEIEHRAISEGCMVMGGHRDGILAFDSSLDLALKRILLL